MRPFLLTAALVSLATGPLPLQADSLPDLYQVEVIVFAHADGRSDGHPVRALHDYGTALDPDEIEADPDEPAVLRPPEQETGDDIRVRPRNYQAAEALSNTMQRALTRLENSGRHQVLTSRGWYQTAPRHQLTRPVRIHDLEVVYEDLPPEDPFAAVIASTDLEPREEPVTRRWYRTDGSVRLSRRQFYHLALDLEWRVAVPAYGLDRARLDFVPEYLVHRLNQSRTIRPGRLEYFDSSWLGALVHVTALDD